MGLSGILLLISVLTGLLTHTKLIKDRFTWRLFRSPRLKWQDSHKILGLWSLPYVVMIAFTGAFLGLIVVMLPATALLVYKGDREAIAEAISGPELHRTGISSNMTPILPLIDTVTHQTKVKPERLLIRRWGDETAHYVFIYPVQGKLIRFGRYTISAADSGFVEHKLTDGPGMAWRVVSAVTPLHYATYGGLALKLLYAVLAGLLCIMIVMGTLIWLERKQQASENKDKINSHALIAKLNVGVTTGLVFAIIAVLAGANFTNVEPNSRLFWTGTIFFSSWFAVISYCLFRRSQLQAFREVSGFCGITMICLGLYGLSFWFADAFNGSGFYPGMVDTVILLIGVIIVSMIR
ncbi:MAG: PepSY-associated TM helix domain-containing protein, partial [Pseudomonadota bacterium]